MYLTKLVKIEDFDVNSISSYKWVAFINLRGYRPTPEELDAVDIISQDDKYAVLISDNDVSTTKWTKILSLLGAVSEIFDREQMFILYFEAQAIFSPDTRKESVTIRYFRQEDIYREECSPPLVCLVDEMLKTAEAKEKQRSFFAVSKDDLWNALKIALPFLAPFMGS